MSKGEAVKNYNDAVSVYQNITHSAGIHLKPLTKISRSEVEERMDQIESAKEEINNPQRIQKLNRMKNYLLEVYYGI